MWPPHKGSHKNLKRWTCAWLCSEVKWPLPQIKRSTFVEWYICMIQLTSRLLLAYTRGIIWFNPLWCFSGSEGHVALDRNLGPGYDTLLLRMIPGDLLSTFPHRQFHTLPGLLDSWAALPNSYHSALRAMQGGSLYHFYDGLWYDPAERRTHDLPCERRIRYRLSQLDTAVSWNKP